MAKSMNSYVTEVLGELTLQNISLRVERDLLQEEVAALKLAAVVPAVNAERAK